MMEGICFIGDSHTGAIGKAERRLDKDGRNTATYFVAMHNVWGDPFDWRRGDGAKVQKFHFPLGLTVSGSELRPNNEALETSFVECARKSFISVDEYDAFVCIDCTFSVTLLFNLAQIYRHDRMRASPHNQILISEACFKAAIAGLVEQTWSMQIARMLRGMTTKPVYVIPEPFASSDVPETASGKAGLYIIAKNNSYLEEFGKMFSEICAGLQKEMKVTLLEQPPETVQDHVFTRREYAQSSLIERPEDDLLHTNERWGELVIQDLVQDLANRQTSQQGVPGRLKISSPSRTICC
jgi:hypothetical protein